MKSPRAFITGIAGFAGSWLAEELLAQGYQVAGSIYNHEPIDNIRHLENKLDLHELDIVDGEATTSLLTRLRPQYLFHLAAFASVGRSHQKVHVTLRVNLDGTLNMLEAARQLKGLKQLLFVSSAEVYGIFTPKTKTLTEKQPVNPVSPYGISKAAAEKLALYYHRVYDLPVVIIRAFNHSGPRQTDDFVIPAFARQIAKIEAGRQKSVLKVGDLSAKRDFSDVRDIVRGYRLAAEKGTPGEIYQLCSGKAVTVQKVLDILLAGAHKKVTVKPDPARMRKADIPLLRGNNRKAAAQFGFTIRYKLKETLTDTLDYWRNKTQV